LRFEVPPQATSVANISTAVARRTLPMTYRLTLHASRRAELGWSFLLLGRGGQIRRSPFTRAPPHARTIERDTRIDWAMLLKRVHDVDALACPCGGRLRVIALITEPEVVVAILTSVHLPAVAPPVAKGSLHRRPRPGVGLTRSAPHARHEEI
jgi:hypothetical protein